MNDPSMELWRFDEDDLTLEIFAGRRMARFITSRGASPILFKVKDQPIAAFMNTSYCRDPRGGWIQIR